MMHVDCHHPPIGYIEVSLWSAAQQRQLLWRPYRPPVRFWNLSAYCMIVYRCGAVQVEGRLVLPDADGVVTVEEPDVVGQFLDDLTAFPVFVLATLIERAALIGAANKRRIPFHNFSNGLGFRTTEEAVLAKMTMPL